MDQDVNCVVIPDLWIKFNEALEKIGEKDYEKLTDLFLEKEENIFTEEFFEIIDRIIPHIEILKNIPIDQARAFVLAASLFTIFDGHLMYFFISNLGNMYIRPVLAVAAENEKQTRH